MDSFQRFEISAAYLSGSTVHFIHISVINRAVTVNFPASSDRVQFWSHSSLFPYTSAYVEIFLYIGKIKVLKDFSVKIAMSK